MKQLLLLVGVGLIAACNPQKSNNPIANVTQAGKDVNLQGRFISPDCGKSAMGVVLQDMPSTKVSYKFEGENVTRETAYYPTNDCTGGPGYTFREMGKMEVKDDRPSTDASTSNERVRAVDFNFDKLLVHIDSEAGAKAANKTGLSMCGKNDWKVNDEVNVTAHVNDPRCWTSKVARELQVYRVNGDLILGNAGTMSLTKDQEGRPTQLDRSKRFVKQ